MIEVGVELKDEPLPSDFKGDVLFVSIERYSLFSAFEKKDLLSWLEQTKTKLGLITGKFLYNLQEDPDVLRERLMTAPEQMRYLIVRLNSEVMRDPDATLSVISLIQKFHLDMISLGFDFQISFDFGEQLEDYRNQNWSSVVNQISLCVDPLWRCSKEIGDLATYWMIRGAHESRWVRYFSSEQIEELFTWSRKHAGPLTICFSHSKRWEQCIQLQALVADANLPS